MEFGTSILATLATLTCLAVIEILKWRARYV
jgi:hypothetical protein